MHDSIEGDSSQSDPILAIRSMFNNLHTISNIDSKKDIVLDGLTAGNEALKKDLECIDRILNSSLGLKEDIESELLNKLRNIVNILESKIFLLKHLASLTAIENSSFDVVPKYIAEVLLLMFTHCKNSETIYSSYFQEIGKNITEVFKKCHDLQILYFAFLTEHFQFELCQDYQLEMFLDVLDVVVDIGGIVIELDVKSMAEEWKGYLKLCEKYADAIKDRYVHHKATKILCNEIQTCLTSLVSEQTNDPKVVNRSLKTSNFILKILVKLSEVFEGYLCEDHEHIIQFFIIIYQYSTPYLSRMNIRPILIEGIRSHINVGAELLLTNLLSDSCFRISLIQFIKKKEANKTLNFGYLCFTVTIIKLLLQAKEDTRNDWISTEENYNIICLLFYVIDFCEIEFYQSFIFDCVPIGTISFYDYALINMACLTMSSESLNVIEEELLKSIFKSDVGIALFACDLWLIIARYGSVEYCFELLKYLIDTHIKLVSSKMMNKSIQCVVISHLISNLFILLPRNHKLQIYNQYSIYENLDVWIAIGLENLPNDQIIVDSETLLKDCNASLEKLSTSENISIILYQNLLKKTQLLSCVSLENNSNQTLIKTFVQKIVKAWEYAILSNNLKSIISKNETTVHGSQWFYDYITNLCEITINIVPYTTNDIWLKVLGTLVILLEKSPSIIMLAILQILESFTYYNIKNDNHINKLTIMISYCFKALMNCNNHIVRLMAVTKFAYLVRNTENELLVIYTLFENKLLKKKVTELILNKFRIAVDSAILYFHNSKNSFKHKCVFHKVDNMDIDRVIDEKCDDLFDGNNEMISAQLHVLKEKTASLENMCKNTKLSDMQKSDLKKVHSIISKLIEL